ncbi:hypothetical protein CLV74_101175 [Donghicola tyrosinivorans]|uniref:Uncharacterized protein n=1 Tax=Donghicola tyrosinivorans TaxID=1652492 RepID=A0A2T0X553_9RHOB|nr:hypothetical protein CLV74_101175 [Donghicola tyrosinivorans]
MIIYNIRILSRRAAIGLALKSPAPKIIPLSDPERLRARNYFTCRLTNDDRDEAFVAESLSQKGLQGLWFDKRNERAEVSLQNKFLPSLNFEVIHYAQELEIRYISSLDFLWSTLTLKARRELAKHRFKIWAFSKAKLPREDRMEVLVWAYHWTLKKRDFRPTFTTHSFLLEKHGKLFYYHPQKEELTKYYRIVFESLVESGEFNREPNSSLVRLTPKALATLENYEESDRRHLDNLRQQRILGQPKSCLRCLLLRRTPTPAAPARSRTGPRPAAPLRRQ